MNQAPGLHSPEATSSEFSEQRFRSVIAAMAEGVVVQNRDGAIVTWNSSAERILGLSSDQLSGRTSLDPRWGAVREDGRPFPGEEHPAMVTLRTGVAQRDVIMGVNKPDGAQTWISINTQPIHADDKQLPGGVVATFRDITESRRTGMALCESSTRIHAILDTVIDGIVTIDERGLIESFNPAAERMFEYRAAEVIGRNVNQLLPEPFHSAHDGYLAKYLASGEKRIIGIGREVVGQKKSGDTFPLDLAVSEMRIDSRRMFVGVLRDITERKKLEGVQKQFIANVSHELRTPLNAILGFTQLLAFDPVLNDAHKANLRKVSKAGEHLLHLINDVMDLSRIEAGSVSLLMEPVAVDPVMRECLQLTQQPADERNVRLQVDPDSVNNLRVMADRTRLRQVLLNLLSNAVKYNHDGGRVWLACTAVTPDRVRVSVRDNGPGIDPDRQPGVFQPFNRLGAERSDIEGTGIGLTICRQLATLMGGTIGFSSVPGEGSTFWIELEATVSAPTETEIPSVAGASLRSRDGAYRVLCVEDNPANMELVRALVAQFWPHAKFVGASSAETGLELAAVQRPHLILMDINLPGIDGYDALARLQNDPVLRTIPVVAISANATVENIAHGRAAGFVDYLTKPIDIPRFLATIDALLIRADAQTPEIAADTHVAAAQSAPAGNRPVLDPRMTSQLQSLLGARAVPIVDSLLDDLPRRMAIMRAAIDRNDVTGVRAEAHTMRGSSSNLGATDFCNLCARISEFCKTDQWARVPETWVALDTEFNARVKPALLHYRGELLVAG